MMDKLCFCFLSYMDLLIILNKFELHTWFFELLNNMVLYAFCNIKTYSAGYNFNA